MQWYWWVLIAAGIVASGCLKLYFFNRIKKSKAKETKKNDED